MKYFGYLVAAALVAGNCPTASAALFSSFVNQVQTNPSGTKVRLMNTDLPPNGSQQEDTYGNANGGGEFRIELKVGAGFQTITYDPSGDPSSSWAYKTFCAEMGEHFTPGLEYWVTIDDAAWYGTNPGPAPTGVPDPLHGMTKVLYGLYFDGRLDDAGIGGGFDYLHNGWANAVQQVVWNLEDTQSIANGSQADQLRDWLADNYEDYLAEYEDTVKVLNVWSDPTDRSRDSARQSQLIRVQAVPEPATIVLWSGLAAVGLALSRRRRK